MPSVPPTKRRPTGPADPRPAPGAPGEERQFGPDLAGMNLVKRRFIGVLVIAVLLGLILMAVFSG